MRGQEQNWEDGTIVTVPQATGRYHAALGTGPAPPGPGWLRVALDQDAFKGEFSRSATGVWGPGLVRKTRAQTSDLCRAAGLLERDSRALWF